MKVMSQDDKDCRPGASTCRATSFECCDVSTQASDNVLLTQVSRQKHVLYKIAQTGTS